MTPREHERERGGGYQREKGEKLARSERGITGRGRRRMEENKGGVRVGRVGE